MIPLRVWLAIAPPQSDINVVQEQVSRHVSSQVRASVLAALEPSGEHRAWINDYCARTGAHSTVKEPRQQIRKSCFHAPGSSKPVDDWMLVLALTQDDSSSGLHIHCHADYCQEGCTRNRWAIQTRVYTHVSRQPRSHALVFRSRSDEPSSGPRNPIAPANTTVCRMSVLPCYICTVPNSLCSPSFLKALPRQPSLAHNP